MKNVVNFGACYCGPWISIEMNQNSRDSTQVAWESPPTSRMHVSCKHGECLNVVFKNMFLYCESQREH